MVRGASAGGDEKSTARRESATGKKARESLLSVNRRFFFASADAKKPIRGAWVGRRGGARPAPPPPAPAAHPRFFCRARSPKKTPRGGPPPPPGGPPPRAAPAVAGPAACRARSVWRRARDREGGTRRETHLVGLGGWQGDSLLDGLSLDDATRDDALGAGATGAADGRSGAHVGGSHGEVGGHGGHLRKGVVKRCWWC